MGVTYLPMDKVLRRRVALKVIDIPETSVGRDSQAVRERFLREARAAAGLRHPNVAAVFQFGASPDATHCYYALELSRPMSQPANSVGRHRASGVGFV